VRSGRSRQAATIVLNRLTLVLSLTHTSRSATPISGAIFAPTRPGRSIQPAVFHDPIRSRPHSSVAVRERRSGTDRGSAPSEFPSR
jgi:hypothetical protein